MRKLTQEIVEERFNEKGLRLLGEFINVDTPIEFGCLYHPEFKGKVAPKEINRRAKCKLCKPQVRNKPKGYTYKEVEEIFKDNNLTLISKDYKETTSPLSCICNIHKEEGVQKISLASLLTRVSGNKGCPYCIGSKKSEYDIKNILEKRNIEFIKKEDDNIYFRCKKHPENVQCRKWNWIQREKVITCLLCSKKERSSSFEKEIVKYIDSLDIKYEQGNKKILQGYELDIYIPDLKIAIECNGLYWHSELFKDSKYHINKTNECKKQGIRLIHIFEDEWNNKEKLVKKKLKYLLHQNNNTSRIYARKCFIKEIDAKLKNEFLERFHIQGKDTASVKLGMFYKKDGKNMLVSVMTFCKPRISLGQKGDKYDYELSRFASTNNYIVVGAFGKMFNYFKDNYEWNKILTYADKRWSEGNVYIKNGWNHTHDSKPNYWYIKKSDKRKREHRFNYRKGSLENKFPSIYSKDKSEKTIMTEAGYIRIWDCGNMVFEYNK